MALRHTFQAALRSTLRLDLRTAPVTILKGDMEKFVVEVFSLAPALRGCVTAVHSKAVTET